MNYHTEELCGGHRVTLIVRDSDKREYDLAWLLFKELRVSVLDGESKYIIEPHQLVQFEKLIYHGFKYIKNSHQVIARGSQFMSVDEALKSIDRGEYKIDEFLRRVDNV